ncbi:proton channel OtopLc-like isoform X2 [Leptidea sinapis]|nr:proton channel OtopLc-like isoform X2 [Leptidea sinapis]XP_050676974.1 proton channel OtopLc-like isoform X2 [Leptidea sinapis]XP_050676975.1 proton channel OtopLc-like isoform X2 [Leptidea sinapis]XP_050676976.1 proton channel OtopLc-like isoform X2 [Leptidea sinapis]XP_050676977.1 proton channel OtopLc-like isoform X2 [Leptidea sinapis]
MSPSKRSPLCDLNESVRPICTVTDMDPVQEENDNDSDESSYSDVARLRERTRAMLAPTVEPLVQNSHSQPNSRRMSSDIDAKIAANLNTRRPSAIIAAFRRPSQALALCAATQRRFLSELSPHSRTSVASAHETPPSSAEILGHDALSKALSALYAKLLVVLGLAFPVTEVITNGVADTYYQAFYLYLYLVSLLFVIFQYGNIMRQKAVKMIIQDHGGDDGVKDKAMPNEKVKSKEMLTRYGSFYLRLGAIAFGIGSMVYSGLEFGEYFEMTDRCRSVLSALTPSLRMALTLAQMQFIFLTNKDIECGAYKFIQRFGFMHMIATNLCEWLYVLVAETKHEIHHLEHSMISYSSNIENDTSEIQCRRSNIMGTLLQNASPFLFPCTIEYSLICAVILYEMWKEIKCTPEDFEKKFYPKNTSRTNSVTPEKILQQFAGMLGVSSPQGSRTALHHFSVDCSHAHRGLFAGILLIVITIISLIMFFVLASNPNTVNDAIFQVNICELILYTLSFIACAVALTQMRALPYKRKCEAVLGLDTSLLILAQSGMFVYCMFSLIGCHHTLYHSKSSGLTGFFSEFLSLNQTILQSLFIIDAWWRRSSSSEHRRNKPGRQLVTFLLVANMAMWAINTLEKNRAEFRPAHLDFYGPWAWTIITHVSMPLAIFYRFHSTICLFEIWKNSFKNKPIYLNV